MAGSSRVLELYSGTGALTLYIARGRQRVVAVEEWPESTDFLRRNMEENGLRGLVDPVGMTAERAVKALSGKSFDAVVLDPPRKGCSMEVLSGLTKILPPLIIYISCNPATLARDASFLCANGYRLREVRAFDMFPQTSHVECLSVFERGNQFPLSSPSRLAFV
jgi:23S rRNA (uracil1939-C5)-methyltransferase